MLILTDCNEIGVGNIGILQLYSDSPVILLFYRITIHKCYLFTSNFKVRLSCAISFALSFVIYYFK